MFDTVLKYAAVLTHIGMYFLTLWVILHVYDSAYDAGIISHSDNTIVLIIAGLYAVKEIAVRLIVKGEKGRRVANRPVK